MSEEKKQRLKEYQKIMAKLIKTKKLWFLVKQYINSFLITSQNCSLKKCISNCYHKDIFISASNNDVKGKTGINKSLIMYGPILTIYY